MLTRYALVGAVCGTLLLSTMACGRGGEPADAEPEPSYALGVAVPTSSAEQAAEAATSSLASAYGAPSEAGAPSGAQDEPVEKQPTDQNEAPLPTLTRLTDPPCCPLPFWSPDSSQVLFWDAPPGKTPGIYGVAADGGSAAFVSDRPSSIYSRGEFTAIAEGDELRLERTSDGEVWRFDTGGEGLVISADGGRAAWALEMGRYVPGQEPPSLQHMMADLTSGEVVAVEVPDDYALSDWTENDRWLLYLQSRDSDQTRIITFDPDTGASEPLFEGVRLRNGRTSPGGRWHVVMRVYEDNPSGNGLYLLATDGSPGPRKLQQFGSYKWRDGDRLLIVPQEPGEPSMRLLELDARTGSVTAVTDPAATPFAIAAGEWSVAPNGSKVAFRSSVDDAIWVLALPRSSVAP